MTDRELMQMALDALEQPSPIGEFNQQEYVAKALRNRLREPNVSYTGNGTTGRENMTAPTGYFFQMPKSEKPK
jgi:hypothetical protein